MTMRALRLERAGEARLVDAPVPQANTGEVLLRVLAAGLCQTDLHICSASDSRTPDGTILGHEIAGEIVALGDGVQTWALGERVIVHPSWACGSCTACVSGRQNACRNTGGRLQPPATPGVTRNGGMAQFCVSPASALMPIGDLDPAVAATLTDAALTSYHAIETCGVNTAPGTTTVIIGVGGLGNMAAQILRAITATRIVIVDRSSEALVASGPWADHAFLADDEAAAAKIVDMSDGNGADCVLDFVGIETSMAFAASVVARYGAIRVVGLNGGVYPFIARSANNALPRGVTIMCPYGGTYGNLAEVIALAKSGDIKPMISRFDLEHAFDAMAKLRVGDIRGRAVLLPNG